MPVKGEGQQVRSGCHLDSSPTAWTLQLSMTPKAHMNLVAHTTAITARGSTRPTGTELMNNTDSSQDTGPGKEIGMGAVKGQKASFRG